MATFTNMMVLLIPAVSALKRESREKRELSPQL